MKSFNTIYWRLAGFAAVWLLSGFNSSALTVTAVTSDNGYPAHQVQWTDSAGLTRTAVMVDQNSTTPPYTGYLRRYTYQPTNGQPRVCTGTQNYAQGGDLEFSGDGFVQNHTAAPQNGSAGDFSSGNGAGSPGTTAIILNGASHAIIEYDMPTYSISGPYYNPTNQETIPTTIQWFFADGRDNPIFAISQDASQGGGNLGADSRSPYGDIAYDGDGDGTGAFVGGCSYGDTYQFITLAADEVTTNSGWDYNQPNTIPYAMQWADPNTANAEFGHVGTLPILLSDAGQDSQYFNSGAPTNQSFYDDNRGFTAPSGPMINDQTWAYQIFSQNPIWPPGEPTTGIQSKRVTWGANWGRVGGFDDFAAAYNTPGNTPATNDSYFTNYTQHSTDPLGNPTNGQYKSWGNSADGTLMAYSVFVVLGLHNGSFTNGAVARQITQMENIVQATLAVTTGTIAANGNAGVGNATNRTITYSPVGYNPTYAAWEISANSNAVNATLIVSVSYPLDHPVFVIDNYTSGLLPSKISVGTGLTNAGTNYFASLDTSEKRLWITVNRSINSTLNLIVTPANGGTPAPVITSIPSTAAVGDSITIAGQYFSNVTAVAFSGISATNYTVHSSTNISATVPVGAFTGPVTVTTPGGTGTSSTSLTIPGSSPPSFTITVNASPSVAGVVSGGGTFAAGTTNTVIATVNNGYAFSDWATTNGTVLTTTTNYTFALTSNVSLVANFLAPSYPVALFANPDNSGIISIGGTNGGGRFLRGSTQTVIATPANGFEFTGWSGDASGTDNPLMVTVSQDLNITANFSALPTGRTVTVTTNGSGTVTPNLNGKTLTVGKTYILTATAKSGYVFSNWTGSIVTNKTQLKFILETNLVLEANFVANPFLQWKGTYNGLFSASNGITEETAGMLRSLTVSQTGTYTGSILINGASHNVSGSFSLAGQATNSIKRAANLGGPLTLAMSLGNSQITGLVSNANWQATNLIANRGSNTLAPAEYTLLIPPATNAAAPSGDGYALITNQAGTARITGALADGAAFSQSVPVSQTGDAPVYVSLYNNKGMLTGWINLSPTNTNSAALVWAHPLLTGQFTALFVSTNEILLSRWTNAPATNLLPSNLAVVEFANGIAYVTNDFGISISNKTYAFGKSPGPAPYGSIAAKTGLLKMTFGSGASKITGYGVVLLNATNGLDGGGYFVTKTNNGAILPSP